MLIQVVNVFFQLILCCKYWFMHLKTTLSSDLLCVMPVWVGEDCVYSQFIFQNTYTYTHAYTYYMHTHIYVYTYTSPDPTFSSSICMEVETRVGLLGFIFFYIYYFPIPHAGLEIRKCVRWCTMGDFVCVGWICIVALVQPARLNQQAGCLHENGRQLQP